MGVLLPEYFAPMRHYGPSSMKRHLHPLKKFVLGLNEFRISTGPLICLLTMESRLKYPYLSKIDHSDK